MTDTPPEFAEDVRKCAAEQTISEEEVLKKGMEESRRSSWKRARRFTRRRKVLVSIFSQNGH